MSPYIPLQNTINRWGLPADGRRYLETTTTSFHKGPEFYVLMNWSKSQHTKNRWPSLDICTNVEKGKKRDGVCMFVFIRLFSSWYVFFPVSVQVVSVQVKSCVLYVLITFYSLYLNRLFTRNQNRNSPSTLK